MARLMDNVRTPEMMKKISLFETVTLFVDKQCDMLGKANAIRAQGYRT